MELLLMCTALGGGEFDGLTRVEKFTFPSTLQDYDSEWGVTLLMDKII